MLKARSLPNTRIENKWRGFADWLYDPSLDVDNILRALDELMRKMRSNGIGSYCSSVGYDALGICIEYRIIRDNVSLMRRQAKILRKSIEKLKGLVDEYLWRLNAGLLGVDTEYLKNTLAWKLHAAIKAITYKYNEERSNDKPLLPFLENLIATELKDKLSTLCSSIDLHMGIDESSGTHQKKYIDIKCNKATFTLILEINYEEKHKRKQPPKITNIDYEIIPRNPSEN